MTTPGEPHPRPRLLLTLAPVAGGTLAFALALWGLSNLFTVPGPTVPGPNDLSNLTAGPAASEALVTAPARRVQQVHDAMHAIAGRCRPGVTVGPQAQRDLHRSTEVILTFARDFPDARLEIDDESGRTLSLLVGVRDDLLRCAPAVAKRMDPAIPPQFRQPVTAAPS